MKTDVASFREEFPDNKACLRYIFEKKHSYTCPCGGHYYAATQRLCYACSLCGKQIYPLKGSIFERSRTPLIKWFFLIYLFSISKNGVAAMEARRLLGVTEKTSWRMCNLIRSLMKQDTHKLSGIVEADETYIGGRRKIGAWRKKKLCVVGMVERGGQLRVRVLKGKHEYQIVPFVEKNLKKGSTLYTDYAPVYNICRGYKRGRVMHSIGEYVKGTIHTNTIEGFWGQLKRSLHGTHHAVSKQHLSSYVDEFVFRYNASRMNLDPFSLLTERI